MKAFLGKLTFLSFLLLSTFGPLQGAARVTEYNFDNFKDFLS